MKINWAKKYGLPIVTHARDSFNELFDVLDEHNDENLFGVFHCFTGNAEQASKSGTAGAEKRTEAPLRPSGRNGRRYTHADR